MITAAEALARLREGNRRFASDKSSTDFRSHGKRRGDLVLGQEPFAIILGCSDSRVPAELIFDQGLGDLFVIRVAGNVVARTQVGSVEFAVEQFGVPLVVVLGHSSCGAVIATLEDQAVSLGAGVWCSPLRLSLFRTGVAVLGIAAAASESATVTAIPPVTPKVTVAHPP